MHLVLVEGWKHNFQYSHFTLLQLTIRFLAMPWVSFQFRALVGQAASLQLCCFRDRSGSVLTHSLWGTRTNCVPSTTYVTLLASSETKTYFFLWPCLPTCVGDRSSNPEVASAALLMHTPLMWATSVQKWAVDFILHSVSCFSFLNPE